MPIVEKQVLSGQRSAVSDQQEASRRSILMIYPGLLARYEQLGLLEKIRDEIGRSKGLHSCWILIPGDNQAFIDGKAVPIISPGQKTKIPDTWLANIHRAGRSVQHSAMSVLQHGKADSCKLTAESSTGGGQ
jgi:hypothetical protein